MIKPTTTHTATTDPPTPPPRAPATIGLAGACSAIFIISIYGLLSNLKEPESYKILQTKMIPMLATMWRFDQIKKIPVIPTFSY